MKRDYVFKNKWKRTLVLIIDLFGDILFYPLFTKRTSIPVDKIDKILLARIDHLGDALLMRPAIAQLSKTHPQLSIDLLTTPENAPLFELDPDINRVFLFGSHWFQKSAHLIDRIAGFIKMLIILRRQKYDAAIDFRGDVRMNLLFFLSGIPIRLGYGITGGGWMLTHEKTWSPATHQVALNCDLLQSWFSRPDAIKNTPVRYPASAQTRCRESIKNIPRPVALFHAGAGNSSKARSLSFFKSFSEYVLQNKIVCSVLWIGTAAEKKMHDLSFGAQNYDLRGLTDLHELAYLMQEAVFFLGNDSGPAHLAAAQDLPIILTASKTNDIRYWHPWTTKLHIISADDSELEALETAQKGLASLLEARRP